LLFLIIFGVKFLYFASSGHNLNNYQKIENIPINTQDNICQKLHLL